MSHWGRQYEGDIEEISKILNSPDAQKYLESFDKNNKDSEKLDFLKQIHEDYGINFIGGKIYEVEVKGEKHQGTLALIFGILNKENKNENIK